MSNCAKLLKGFTLECDGVPFRKFYQKVVLVNKKDVEKSFVLSDMNNNRCWFKLLENKTGYAFISTELGGSLSAQFSKRNDKGIAMYQHQIQLPIVGVDEASKTMLKQLDASDYFAAIRFKDDTILIYGFNYGLKSTSYTYEPAGMGGSIIELTSKYDEYDPPYIYRPILDSSNNQGLIEQAIIDFDNLFSGTEDIFNGDFNDDFNDDFNNQE